MKKQSNPPGFIMVSDHSLEAFKHDLIETLMRITKEWDIKKFQSTWVESSEVPKILNISSRTWQTYRDKKAIPYSQFGSKIYVKLADIDKFLEDNIHPDFKKPEIKFVNEPTQD